MLEELDKWKDHKVLKSVDYNKQKLIALRWVHFPKIKNGNKKKFLIAEGYHNIIKSDFYLILNIYLACTRL